MEEKEKEESEPLDLRSGDQAELILLVISGEEDATQEESALRGKMRITVTFLTISFAPVWACLAVGATAITKQSANPCQGQYHGAAWPLFQWLL